MKLTIKVQKKNPAGQVTYEYEGSLLSHNGHVITIEALFDRPDMPFMDVVCKTGDRFMEYNYTDRWYNIFAIHDRQDEKIKGWYCNVGMPAKIEDGTVSYVDLALDLWVSVDGTQTVLDVDEFEKLDLDVEQRSGALNGLTLFRREPLRSLHPVWWALMSACLVFPVSVVILHPGDFIYSPDLAEEGILFLGNAG